LGATGAVPEAAVEEAIRETFAAKPAVVEINLEAFRRGLALGRAGAVAQEVVA
jgi:Pyruvate/2-oxoacid:ferredoxin oxidoreductase gamma subunit